jgi:hypothetical protein
MAKLGKPYETLVGLIAKALHPDAVVEVGEWVEGPDGEREIDVSIKGAIDGKDTFILVECKDWKRDVGIGTIDAIDSKRRDLGADRTIVVANGFTDPALAKAHRTDITCMSALAEGNDLIRFVLYREFIAKRLSVTGDSCQVVHGTLAEPTSLDLDRVEYRGLKLKAWMRDRSIQLLRENEFATMIKDLVAFNPSEEFLHFGKPIPINGIEMILECKRAWLVQTVKEDVSKGMYDHIKQVLLIPDKEFWSLEFDNRNWKEITPEIEPRSDIPAGTIQLHMDLFQPIFGDESDAAPPLDFLISQTKTSTVSATSVAIAIKRFNKGKLQYAEQQSMMKTSSAGRR